MITGSGPTQVLIDGSQLFSARTALGALAAVREKALAERASGSPVQRPQVTVLYNPELKTSYIMIPGLCGVILVFIGTIITSLGVVRERQTGTLEQLAVMPLRPRDVFLGKITPYFVVACLDLAIVLAIGVAVFGVPFRGSYAVFGLGALLFLFVTLGLGVLISSVSENQGQAIQLSVMVMLPQVLLSGLIFPLSSIAIGVRWISYILPLTYFNEISRGVMLRAEPIGPLWQPFVFLALLGLIVFTLASLRFRRFLAPAAPRHGRGHPQALPPPAGAQAGVEAAAGGGGPGCRRGGHRGGGPGWHRGGHRGGESGWHRGGHRPGGAGWPGRPDWLSRPSQARRCGERTMTAPSPGQAGPAATATQDWWGTEEACVRYGDKLALDHVTFRALPGRVSAVVGGDGAGRTTLLRCLAGALAVTSGQVRLPPPLRIGYLSAGSGTYPDLSVDENLAFRATAYQVPANVARERSAEFLERAGLSGARDRLAGRLSGGMRQKLGVIASMLHQPDLLVLDEPTTGVDPVSRADLWWLIAQAAANGAAVVFATSYLDEAERALDVLALEAGRELASGTPEEIIAAMPGTLRVSDARPAGEAQAAGVAPWRPLADLGATRPAQPAHPAYRGFASPESWRNGRDHDASP